MFKILYTPNHIGKPSYYLDSIVPGGYKFTSGITANNTCDALNADLRESANMVGVYSVVRV